jgi:glycosyltransferase involved in cell wall biosynthesis
MTRNRSRPVGGTSNRILALAARERVQLGFRWFNRCARIRGPPAAILATVSDCRVDESVHHAEGVTVVGADRTEDLGHSEPTGSKNAAPRQGIVFAWKVSSFFGWGVYGLNLMLYWPYLAVTALPPDRVDAVRTKQDSRLRRRLSASLEMQRTWSAFEGRQLKFEDRAVFVAMGNQMARIRAAHGIDLSGTPTVGVLFFEDSAIDASDKAKLSDIALIVCGSNWNASVLSAAGIAPVKTVLQGVDTNVFRPRPAKGWLPDRFKIFSGGKLEFRKGQDLVLRAFRVFAQRHPEALLITAWQSPGSTVFSRTFSAKPDVPLPPFKEDRSVDVTRWAQSFGVPPEQIVDVGAVPNHEMPNILREIDVAVFPNRCEGGTNLVAMECLASGVPTILSANTGHLDLIERMNALVLTRQTPVIADVPTIRGTEGWGESDIDETIEALEYAYVQRSTMSKRATQCALAMRDLSWQNQIRLLHETVRPIVD